MTRSSPAICISILLTAGFLPAQTTSGYWSAWANSGPSGGVCRYVTGSSVASFPWATTLASFGGGQAVIISPPNVVKHPQGLVYVADTSTLDAFTPGGSQFSLPLPYSFGPPGGSAVISPLGQMGVRPDGDLWILTSTFPPTLTRFTPTGAVVQNVVLSTGMGPGGLPTFVGRLLDVDGAGTAWVADRGGALVQVFANGVVLPVTTLPGGNVTSMDVDGAGRLWAFNRSPVPGFPPTLYRVEPNGTLSLSLAVPGALAFDIDACDRLHVLLQASTIEVREPAAGAVLGTVNIVGNLPSQGAGTLGLETEFVLDVDGSYWLKQGGFVDHVSASGAVISNALDCATGGASSNQNEAGDATGLHLAAVIDPLGDADSDGFANRREIVLGADPFDPAVTPASLAVITPPNPGATLTLAVSLPQDAGFPYLFAAAGSTAGIRLPGLACREVPLALDSVLDLWLGLVSSGFPPSALGLLDASGGAVLSVPLPPTPLGGLPVSFALLTSEPSGSDLSTITDAVSFMLP